MSILESPSEQPYLGPDSGEVVIIAHHEMLERIDATAGSEHYRPFANPLRARAGSYRSKGILSLVDLYPEGKPAP